MTVSVADVQNAIKAGIVSRAAAAGAVVWEEEQRPAAKVLVILKIVQWGNDIDRETYSEDDEEPGQLLWALSTAHHIRIQVQCETTYNAPGVDALFTLEKIRAGLLRPDLTWSSGVVNQPDVNTYIHRVSYPHGGHIISAYSFETNFRAVTDYALEGPLAAGTNMQQVEVIGADAEPPAGDQTIDRDPAP